MIKKLALRVECKKDRYDKKAIGISLFEKDQLLPYYSSILQDINFFILINPYLKYIID